MGATFPFAMAAIRQMSAESGRSFSYLYLANVLGAMAGTLIPAFVLIELLGFQGTLYVACALNMLLAAAVFLFSMTVARYTVRMDKWARPGWPGGTASVSDSKAILPQLFATGICSMALEVIWIRQFTVYLGNVVYAFAIILALYLAATFAGSACYRKWIRTHDINSVGRAWIPLGLFALLPLLAADPRVPIPETLMVVQGLVNGALRTAIGIVPFSALVGFLTPMLVDRWSGGVPERAGRAYAVNVLGSILGPLVAGFLIVPFAGERWGLLLIALPLFYLGLVSSSEKRATYAWAGTVAASLLLLIFYARLQHKISQPYRTARPHSDSAGKRHRHAQTFTGKRHGHDQADADHQDDGASAAGVS